MRQLEAFSLGKKFGHPETNEDSLVVMPNLGYAVIDGGTDAWSAAGRPNLRKREGDGVAGVAAGMAPCGAACAALAAAAIRADPTRSCRG